MRTSADLELLVELRRDDDRTLHRQLEQGLRDAVRAGRLPSGATLPSTRALARQLGISRGVVVEAYEQLVAEGYLATRPGGATQVARRGLFPGARRERAEPKRFDIDFRPGRPDLDRFPRSTWLRSLRRVLAEAPSERFGYLDGRGVPELRWALAEYLDRVRGTDADPELIVVVSGFAQGLSLVAGVLAASGARRVAIEDPSEPHYREMVAARGLEVVGIPVDEAGIRVGPLDTADVDAVLVTPAHQFPTGAVMSAARRSALIAWADRRGGYIIEDDYDAEFRYDRSPIGALQGLRAEQVVYAGSASKILLPGLRLGWLLVPPSLSDALARAKRVADMGSPAIEQMALADFLRTGQLDHHLRRVRPLYRRRRDALLDALGRHVPESLPTGISAGLHVLAWLPSDLDEAALIEAAGAAGIGLEGVAEKRIARSGAPGLVLGYGGVEERDIESGIHRLAEVIAARRGSRPTARGSRSD